MKILNPPNPGSPEAVKMGCKCPMGANQNGLGFPWRKEGEPQFWINAACPLHGADNLKAYLERDYI